MNKQINFNVKSRVPTAAKFKKEAAALLGGYLGYTITAFGWSAMWWRANLTFLPWNEVDV